MSNRKLLKLLLIDKIKKDCKENKFKSKSYWKEFVDYDMDYWFYSVCNIKKILQNLNDYNLKTLKFVYNVYLDLKEKDEKYGNYKTIK